MYIITKIYFVKLYKCQEVLTKICINYILILNLGFNLNVELFPTRILEINGLFQLVFGGLFSVLDR